MPECPRCKRQMPENLFQPPVRICMVCYGSNPGNTHIRYNLDALKEKAAKSRFARRLEVHSDVEKRVALLSGRLLFKRYLPAPTAQDNPIIEIEEETCENCGKVTPDVMGAHVPSIPGSTPERGALICRDCAKALNIKWGIL